jgi:hypothetical protein
MPGVDEAVFKTPEFRCCAAGAILAFAGLVRAGSRFANARLAALSLISVDTTDRKVRRPKRGRRVAAPVQN